MFLKPNQLIVMDTNERYHLGNHPSVALSVDNLRRLRDVGVEYVTEYFTWDLAEPEMGRMNWDECDELVGRVAKAGLNCILCGWNVPLQCAPNDWYAKSPEGHVFKEILSYWNEDAQSYARGFYSQLVSRYKSPYVLVAMCEYLTGECCLHNHPSYFDAAAMKDHQERYGVRPNIQTQDTQEWLCDAVVNHYLDTQSVLVGQHNEIWEDLQWLIARQSSHNGNSSQPCIEECCRDRWPGANYVLCQYTYFAHGEEYFAYIRDLMKKGITLIVEAQYCDGLTKGSPQWAMQHGASGQIVSPLHPFVDKTKLEDWMVEAIASGARQWRDR